MAILGYFEPVGAIILALIFLHEVPDIKALLGGALIFIFRLYDFKEQLTLAHSISFVLYFVYKYITFVNIIVRWRWTFKLVAP